MTVLSAVLLPLVYLFVLGSSLQGPIHGLRLGVVIDDQGPAARAFIGALHAIEQGPRTMNLVAIAALRAVLFRQGDVTAAGPHVLFLGGFAIVMVVLAITTLRRTL
jgi:hypothetical protein